jgi:hypothetical protein
MGHEVIQLRYPGIISALKAPMEAKPSHACSKVRRGGFERLKPISRLVRPPMREGRIQLKIPMTLS